MYDDRRPVSILAVQETRGRIFVPNTLRFGHEEGKAVFYVRPTLTVSVVAEETFFTTISIRTKSGPIFLCSVYIPPDTRRHRATRALKRHLNTLNTDNTPVFVMGDFNCPKTKALEPTLQFKYK